MSQYYNDYSNHRMPFEDYELPDNNSQNNSQSTQSTQNNSQSTHSQNTSQNTHAYNNTPFSKPLAASKQEFNDKWRFFQYLTGQGMLIYNTYKYGLGVEIYGKLFKYIIGRQGIAYEDNAEMAIYWQDEKIDDTWCVGRLINKNIILDIHSLESITQKERDVLLGKMRLTHCKYGYICNFSPTKYYSEWYIRDEKTGNIDRIKLLK